MGPVYGDPRLVPQRLGQRAFQAVVLDAYHRRCAITGAKIRPVLQAAHIRPLPAGGEHRLDNALLLRSDAHTLYDRGYLGVDVRHRLLVSPRLRTSSATVNSSTLGPARPSPCRIAALTVRAAIS
jgi:putative restriction endonuclease